MADLMITAEITPAPAADACTDADNVDVGSSKSSTPSTNNNRGYPYIQILEQLQSIALQSQDPAAASPDGDEPNEEKTPELLAPPQEQQQQAWDLSTDALLATLLHEFASHITHRTHDVASDIRSLQTSVNMVGVDVAQCQTEFMKCSQTIFMEQVVGDDDSESSDSSSSDGDGGDGDGDDHVKEKADKHNANDRQQQIDKEQSKEEVEDDNSSVAIARLEAEEQSAIANGMKALSLFFDPKRPNQRSSSNSNTGSGEGSDSNSNSSKEGVGPGDNNMVVVDTEADIIGDNCYFYHSADGDGFNQRPLPFIIGSREFMESSCGGNGDDDGDSQE